MCFTFHNKALHIPRITHVYVLISKQNKSIGDVSVCNLHVWYELS